MAKLYGALIGTPLQTLQQTGFGRISNLCKDSRDHVLWRDYAVTVAGQAIGDQVSLGTFRSTAFIETLNSRLGYDAFGAGATLNIGDATYPAGLSAAIAIATANLAGAPLVAIMPAAQIVAPLWQRLGYPSNPGGNIELLATFAGAAPAVGGRLAWAIYGRDV